MFNENDLAKRAIRRAPVARLSLALTICGLAAIGGCDDDSTAPYTGVMNPAVPGTTGMEPPAGTTGMEPAGTTGMEAPTTGVDGGVTTTGDGGVTTGDGGGTTTDDSGLADGGTDGAMTDGGDGEMGDGECCSDGDCLCHGPAPSGLTSSDGPFDTDTFSIRGVGCVTYPTDAEPPFAAVAISDGYLGSGGCGRTQTSGWAPFYASHGIVTMIVETGAGDQPGARGRALADGIEAFKEANEDSGSPLYQKLAGRYGTSGFSMGGGGTTIAAEADSSLLTSVAVMPWRPVGRGVTVPTLVICGSRDSTASCRSHGTPAYEAMPSDTPKMQVTVSAGHSGQPTAGGGDSGAAGLAFQKVFLEGDERWESVLNSVDADETNIQ